MDLPKIVIHYAKEHKLIKGYSLNFKQNAPTFSIQSLDSPEQKVEVNIKDLKAIFFVRDFSGDPQYKERKDFLKGEHPLGRRVQINFEDGETIVGTTMYYNPSQLGFFLFPVDLKSNNIRIFVVNSAVKEVKFL